ncbi:MAG: glycoside hydrolase family 57 protein [DPANN group archaeon]|nr:glycoside hydrolase family 57 protein [DPANN group archaeon]
MSSVCFYFQVHQPRRLKPGHLINTSGVNTIAKLDNAIFDDHKNKEIIDKVAGKCYFPANNLMLDQIEEFKGQRRKFKISYSLSGVFIDTLERHNRDLLESFKLLSDSGCVEFLSETYYHSLSSFWGQGVDRTEFKDQVKMHYDTVKSLLGYKPKVFRNTELLYNNSIAKTVESMGFKGILAEGIERALEGWKSPEYVYTPPQSKIAILLRHYKLSDDMSYRFSARWFEGWPVTADKYAGWVSQCQGETINLFMDYETFGEHQWHDTGIFNFLRHLPQHILKWDHMDFKTPSEIISSYKPKGTIDISDFSTISWADLERDSSAWLGNDMQRLVFRELQRIGLFVLKTKDKDLIGIWRHLQTSDHLYYCCTKSWGDGDVHTYFSPYGTPHESFEALIKAMTQLEFVAKKKLKELNLDNNLEHISSLDAKSKTFYDVLNLSQKVKDGLSGKSKPKVN